ncbi:hypothetical protein PG993_006326 [Apiospora rasikravindrae]|uniref:Mesaconyl-C4 CoA hydratase n=1 Tax=Apiospora rasikravindrae TaxID=990691 RepID=A0ABR1T5D9_9PEZI
MATRQAALARGRQLARLYHFEHHSFQSSLLYAAEAKRGFSSYKPLALSSSQARRHGASAAAAPLDIEALRAEMLARPEQLTWDTMSPTPSYLLDISLSDYLDGKQSHNNTNGKGNGNESTILTNGGSLDPKTIKYPPPPRRGNPQAPELKQGYHLIHFPLALPPSQLCPDGTDPYHSPGAPFERRMWAGGSIEFRRPLWLDSRPAVCAERIQDVSVRGPPGDEKAFVDVLRCYGATGRDGKTGRVVMSEAPEGAVREVRTLVFMRKQEAQSSNPEATGTGSSTSNGNTERLIKVPYKPTYTRTLTPTRTLLFHFSALSYNAHLIHLDTHYSQTVEARPNLLVHGPLALNLLLAVFRQSFAPTTTPISTPPEDLLPLDGSLDDLTPEALEQMSSSAPAAACPPVWRIDYRNLAPLYVDEEMTVCVRSHKGSHKHDVWIENRHGGLCVKGTVLTRESAEAKSAMFRMQWEKKKTKSLLRKERSQSQDSLGLADHDAGSHEGENNTVMGNALSYLPMRNKYSTRNL